MQYLSETELLNKQHSSCIISTNRIQTRYKSCFKTARWHIKQFSKQTCRVTTDATRQQHTLKREHNMPLVEPVQFMSLLKDVTLLFQISWGVSGSFKFQRQRRFFHAFLRSYRVASVFHALFIYELNLLLVVSSSFYIAVLFR